MNTRKKIRGYFDMTDAVFGFALVMTLSMLSLLVVLLIVEASIEWKPGVVEQTAIECVPAVAAVEATETTEAVVEQGPYTCTITAKMDDQYMRDLFEANGYLQTLEYGQHRIGDPYPEVPEVETDEGGKIVVISVTTEKEKE